MAYLVSVAVPGKCENIAIVSSTDEATKLIGDLVELNAKMKDPAREAVDEFSDAWGRDVFLSYVQKVSYRYLSYLNHYSFSIVYIPSVGE